MEVGCEGGSKRRERGEQEVKVIPSKRNDGTYHLFGRENYGFTIDLSENFVMTAPQYISFVRKLFPDGRGYELHNNIIRIKVPPRYHKYLRAICCGTSLSLVIREALNENKG